MPYSFGTNKSTTGICRLNDGTLFICLYNVNSPYKPEVWKSTDDGETWTKKTDPWSSNRFVPSIATDGTSTLYVIASDINRTGAYMKRSTDLGDTWSSEKTIKSPSGTDKLIDLQIEYETTNTLLACWIRRISNDKYDVEIEVYRSTNNGDNWGLHSLAADEGPGNPYSYEDVDIFVDSTGKWWVSWEKEWTEEGRAGVFCKYYDGSWSSEIQIYEDEQTDNEGPAIIEVAGQIWCLWSSSRTDFGDPDAGSYDKCQLQRMVYQPVTESFASRVQLSPINGLVMGAEIDNNGDIRCCLDLNVHVTDYWEAATILVPLSNRTDYTDGWLLFDTDVNQILQAILGNGVIEGLRVVESDTPGMSVKILEGSARINSVPQDKKSTTTVNLNAADPTNPRKDVIYITSSGTITKATGTPYAAKPTGETGPKTSRPKPPDIPTDCIELAEIWIAANATAIYNADVTDRRIYVR